MKTSRLIGVLVLTAIGVGVFLGAILPDFGFGLGSGGGLGNPASPANSNTGTLVGTQTDSGKAATIPVIESSTPNESAEPVEPAGPVETVFVLIDGREYLLRRGAEGQAAYKPATLDEVVQAAQAATGDDVGIRIKIAQKRSSRETTERALRSKLEEAGIPGDAIRWKDEPADSLPAESP